MPQLTIIYGEEVREVEAEVGALLGDVIATTGLPLEQPCAGRGTCGLCKVIAEKGLAPPDEIELEHLTRGELAIKNRLACRARIQEDARVVLSPIVVYSNKIFRGSTRYKREKDVELGVAIDLGSTTVAAFLTMQDNGEVCAGAASLNQQTVYGADVISRLAAAVNNPEDQERLHKLAVASINQAVDALKLSDKVRERIRTVSVVGNVAMHHLLVGLPLDTLAVMPFQPYDRASIIDGIEIMEGIFPDGTSVKIPPLIGGFVGSDALACLAYFGFDTSDMPIAAIDLGTNGEVLVTDGKRILTASTAAGPAFEGVNISCGTRAVDGAIVQTRIDGSELLLETIGDEPPVGLTGSGLLSVVHELRHAGVIDASGRIQAAPAVLSERIDVGPDGGRRLQLAPGQDLYLNQWDVRELQKAKGAIRAAIEILMAQLELKPEDLQRFILTGSFGGQVDIEAALNLGMIPPVRVEIVETQANGAGFGAAMFLAGEGFARGEQIAEQAEQIDLDLDPDFNNHYISGMGLSQDGFAFGK
jgi:uncharacterized 2Fe-2S/4Fe-4S cluster protein (DUF4445 family)